MKLSRKILLCLRVPTYVLKQPMKWLARGPEGIDLVESSIVAYEEIVFCETLSFVQLEKGGKLIDKREIKIGEKIPISPSGGQRFNNAPMLPSSCLFSSNHPFLPMKGMWAIKSLLSQGPSSIRPENPC